MRIYDSLSRTTVDLPPTDKPLGIYVCGITPYDEPHLGHARAAVLFDAFIRFLRSTGRTVTYVRNITDVDDKIINKAGSNFQELVERYVSRYHEVLNALDCAPPDVEPRVSEHMPEILSLITDLIDRGVAYEAGGSVYFSVNSFSEYGRLSRRDPDDLISGTRVELESEKRSPLDFALWKTAKPGEPFWPSPWGNGRPGWHIECSAMARRYLGDSFEIHGGGLDLIFPHHENERAQSKCCTGVEPAHIWMHNGLITLNDTKMSKSLGNTLAVDSLIDQYGAQTVRYFLLSTHYASPLDVSEDRFVEIGRALERFQTLDAAVRDTELPKDHEERTDRIRAEFIDALEDNFNTPKAFGILFESIRHANTSDKSDAAAIAKAIHDSFDIIGIRLKSTEDEPDSEIEKLIAERQEARKTRDFARSDEIRDELLERGIILEDTPEGPRWRRSRQ